MTELSLRIADRPIGPGHPVYVIAELSANHHQNLDTALELVRAAARAGADAIKLQTYTPDTLTLKSDLPHFRIGKGTAWAGQTLYDLYAGAFTPWEWHKEIFSAARAAGLHAFSSPFDATAVDFLGKLDVPAYKIASFELVDTPLIERVARMGKPMILSTGMASLQDIEQGVAAARAGGCKDLALLRCNSAYPAPEGEMDLRTIPDMQKRFGCAIGLSDHTLGPAAAVTAVALGACIVEKHIILDRATGGPDSGFSTQPDEFREMVSLMRSAQKALGTVRYGPTERERPSLEFRRSLFAIEDIRVGEALTERNVRSIRPAAGLPPKELRNVLGRRAKVAISRGTPLSWALVD